MVAVEADTCIGAGEGSRQLPEAFLCNDLVDEFTNVFKPSGMPAERETMHRIELEPMLRLRFWH